MPLLLNSLFEQEGIEPAAIVLLRHQDTRRHMRTPPYLLWRDHRDDFEIYQATQTFANRSRLKADYWASFVVTPDRQTLFAGLYNVLSVSELRQDRVFAHDNGMNPAGSCDEYLTALSPCLSDLIGRLYIQWGDGARSWIQRANFQNKPVLKLTSDLHEPPYPGHLNFIERLSQIASLPPTWAAILSQSRGVYLLTCPRTYEQYVGAAYGEYGFWQRWNDYASSGHGGNIALQSREPSDYQVSILEVAGTSASVNDILDMEARWKQKLQSREMGLNRN